MRDVLDCACLLTGLRISIWGANLRASKMIIILIDYIDGANH